MFIFPPMTLALGHSAFKNPVKSCFHEVAMRAVALAWHHPHSQAIPSGSSWRHWGEGLQPDPGCSGQCLCASGQSPRMGIPHHSGLCPRDVLPWDSSSINEAIFRLQKQPPFLSLLPQPNSWTIQSLTPLLIVVVILLLLGS